VSRTSRYAMAGTVQTALDAIQQDLDLARYEPASVRPGFDWLEVRRRAVGEISVLTAPLLVGSGVVPGSLDGVARRLDQLADPVRTGPVSPGGSGMSVESSSATAVALERVVQPHLQGLERALAQGPNEKPEGATDHAPA
jgi:multidrug resistance protein MdtO